MSLEPVEKKWFYCSALLALLCQLEPEFLQYDRQSPLEFWRLYTAHFVHWDLNHLCWDLLLYISIGLLLIKEDPRVFGVNLFLSPILISMTLWIAEPEMLYYRGISGLDAALFTSLAILWINKGDTVFIWLGILQLVLISSKILYELNTHETLFTDSQSYVVIPTAHLAGALSACIITLCRLKKTGTSKFGLRV